MSYISAYNFTIILYHLSLHNIHMLYIFTATALIGLSQTAFLWLAPTTDNGYVRFKRDIASQKENNCTLSCLEEMDAAFNKTYNASSRSYWDDEKYDEKRLDKLCNAYKPSSECLSQCQKKNFQIVVVGSFSMLEFMCISHNKEAKQVFPCLNKLDQETTQKMCDPKCQIYKQALKKWETLRMTPEVVTDNFDELAAVFSKSCSYVKCEKDCSSPGIVNQCGNYGKLFMDSFWRTMLESLNNTTMIANMILNNSRLRGKSFPLCRN